MVGVVGEDTFWAHLGSFRPTYAAMTNANASVDRRNPAPADAAQRALVALRRRWRKSGIWSTTGAAPTHLTVWSIPARLMNASFARLTGPPCTQVTSYGLAGGQRLPTRTRNLGLVVR